MSSNALPAQEDRAIMMDEEEASICIADLQGKVEINLEGVDVIQGYDRVRGSVSLVKPAAGKSLLIYPTAS